MIGAEPAVPRPLIAGWVGLVCSELVTVLSDVLLQQQPMAALTTPFNGEGAPLIATRGEDRRERDRRERRCTPPPDYETAFLSDDSLPSARNRNMERRMQRRPANPVYSSTPSLYHGDQYGSTSSRVSKKRNDIRDSHECMVTLAVCHCSSYF